jgi:hypothetical protein
LLEMMRDLRRERLVRQVRPRERVEIALETFE